MNNRGVGPRKMLRGKNDCFRRAVSVLAAAVLALGAMAGGSAQATERMRQRVVITNDYGGSVSARAQQISAMRSAGQAVAVPYGNCMSACTMYLGLPGTCVGPNAVFGFHGPKAGSGIGLPKAEFERWSQVMASYYPAPLREWFLREGRYHTVDYIAISGAELIRMGVARCA